MPVRRPFVAVVLAAGVWSLGGCATFSEAAASVGGDEIAADTFLARLADVAEAGIAAVSLDESTQTVPADGARALLEVMIRATATRDVLADAGESITDADREAFLAGVPPEQLEGLTDELQALLVDNAASAAALARIPTPPAAELERRYDELPAGLGVLCLRHILVDTRAEAAEIIDDLDAGADFAELAAERSTDEGSAPNGGALGTEDQACLDLTTARQSLDPAFVAGAFGARPGQPTEPVQSQFGWHVILARPFDEVASSIDALYQSDSTPLAVDAYLATADVSVDPRYGTWDRDAANVVALGSAPDVAAPIG